MGERSPVFSLGFHRTRPYRLIVGLVDTMRLQDQENLENAKLRAEIRRLQDENAALRLELEEERRLALRSDLGLTFTVTEGQLSLL